MNWQSARVSRTGTHHELGGLPLYAARFDHVQKFHPPGLAPVLRDGRAWHIRPDGEPAYERRFERSFGFYEGLAAVSLGETSWHIRADGADAYEARFAWCGNFQEGRCAVRDQAGKWRHIDAAGRVIGEASWCYAGDYRDGVAVVQGEDGLSTHVDLEGRLTHGRWFEDLDVFHKGWARAKAPDGWTHVGRSGVPAYSRRFAMVEPFYNGRARVERFDGGLEVIDETGRTVTELRPARRSEFAALSADLVGFWKTYAITAAVELGVFDVLPATTAEIARSCDLVLDRTSRLLRALQELKLVERDVQDRWSVTTRGAFLCRRHPLTLADAAVEYARRFVPMWSELTTALRRQSQWTPPDVFRDVAADSVRTIVHHRMLTSYARHDYPAVVRALGLRGDETVLDVGGGAGTLSELLLREYPEIRVVLLDLPEVASRAKVDASVTDRFSTVPGDFFAAGTWGVRADAAVLARVLHDWDDLAAEQVLRKVRASLATGSKVFVVEMLLSEGSASGALCDLHLLVVTGGRERTAEAYARILAAAGFTLLEVRRLPALPSIVVGEAT